jgi:hypothetical protein
MVRLVTPKAYSPLSVAFEQPKSSLPPAQAAPLNAGKTIVAARIPLESHLFIFDLPPWSWNALGQLPRPVVEGGSFPKSGQ